MPSKKHMGIEKLVIDEAAIELIEKRLAVEAKVKSKEKSYEA